MIRKMLSYILILLAIMSGVTVAYAHQSHSTETERTLIDNSHGLTAVAEAPRSDESDKSSVDEYGLHLCHHFTGIFLLAENDGKDADLLTQNIFEYGLNFPSALISPHLRPPIL